MKELYHDMVSKEHRHIYGEYYTPDWLAEMVCYEVIDDDYIRSQIEKFDAGEELDKILDPACGSGTFLYHAGRRVLESMPMIESHMELDKKKKFIRKLICGIDIHPVAVEMAFANMNRLLNTSSNTEIQIYQGDSLLSSHIQAKNKITSYQTIGDHEYLHLTTPKQKDLIIPATFTKNNSNVKRFVLSAYDSNPFPNSLTRGLSEDEIAVLKESYDKLIKIIYDEGNGIWSWYIRNQAAPLLLLNGKKMGRIVTNPPWVRNSTIQDKARTKQLIEMGQIHKLYVGGKDSTHFNLASLFVVRTRKLYLDENSKSGWVLPQVALTGTGQWEKLRENLESTKQIDLTNLAFPTHSKSCVIVTDEFNTKMVLQKNENFDANESWVDSVQNKTKLVKVLNNFKNEKSSWFKGNRTLAGQGSTMVPSVLVIIDQIKMEKNDQALIKTKKSKHKPWKKFGMQEGIIPKSWIKNFKFSNNIAAFHSPTSRQIILPMNKKGQWDKARLKNDYWRDASAIYEKNVGTGASTPHTLEERLDFNRRLSSQFEDNPLQLIYNRSGNRIYAFVALPNTMIDASAYRVPCKSKKEAYFLSGILNSDILQPRLRATRESDRDFHTLFWYKIPIPRYDSKNSTHIRLAELALQAEKIAKTSYTEGQSQQKMRLASLRAVEDAGIMSDLDACVKKILPDHV